MVVRKACVRGITVFDDQQKGTVGVGYSARTNEYKAARLFCLCDGDDVVVTTTWPATGGWPPPRSFFWNTEAGVFLTVPCTSSVMTLLDYLLGLAHLMTNNPNISLV
jgi:hypothetical protein